MGKGQADTSKITNPSGWHLDIFSGHPKRTLDMEAPFSRPWSVKDQQVVAEGRRGRHQMERKIWHPETSVRRSRKTYPRVFNCMENKLYSVQTCPRVCLNHPRTTFLVYKTWTWVIEAAIKGTKFKKKKKKE